MAKDKSKSGNGAASESEKEEVKPTLSADEKKKLFLSYEKAFADHLAAEKALTAAQAKRTATVLAIVDALGTGPFKWRDEVLISMKRTKKDGTTVAFFRGPGMPDVQEI